MLITLPKYPIHCTRCGRQQAKCINFEECLYRCAKCGYSFKTGDYGLPPEYVEDFPYPKIYQE